MYQSIKKTRRKKKRSRTMDRKLDGMFFRVKRDGKWGNVCISDMTNEEREECLKNKDPQFLKRVIDNLCETLKGIGDQFDLARE